jgi:hypothetical protein
MKERKFKELHKAHVLRYNQLRESLVCFQTSHLFQDKNNELAFFSLCSSFAQHWHDISHHAIELHTNVGDLCSCLTLRKKTKKALKIPIRPSCTPLLLYLFVARNKQIYLLAWIGKALEPALRDLLSFEGYF